MLGCAGLMLAGGAGVAPASSASSTATAASGWTVGAKAAAARAGRPLLAVSCSSPRACTAVGGVFAERWNGRRWSVQNVPAPALSDPTLSFLGGVSCPAPSACIAVGLLHPPLSANTAYNFSALAARWEGGAWSDRSPTVNETPNGYLLGISCPSASDCIAVGQQGTSALAMRWHANRWRVGLYAAGSPGMSVLNGVSCTSARSCIAVGYTAPNQTVLPRALIERWNGRAWSRMRAPTPSPPESVFLNAVSCARGSCTAVGSDGFQQLVERWDGRRWSIQPAPPGTSAAELNGVSCVSPTDCTAVGGRSNSHEPLAERWNGSRWSVEHTPAIALASLLWAVSCPSAGECVAVGTRGGLPLLERWNGTRWSVQASH